ncbi:MAG: DNA polymerase III subunit gamma/tau [Rhodospirillaceae bacterium]|nr:DNA polymerase III subunit gamma/tau [Rhodospirillaceae bacterium]
MTEKQVDKDASADTYRVLARKYRPTTFGQLIGQDALVRTLTNAITSGRLAQGYMLTGVRGVGKTTTARLIARALNCIGPDGKGGPTPGPCGVCVHCKAIAEDRHVDVLEMDAASRTGIDDIRELLDGVRYRPTSARYKIYIVDEVHMLSEKAFNALLKTLEEPPEHVKFIFATTEIRKVPVTVLSRCQRFDLRRIESAELQKLFAEISTREGAEVEEGALKLIARAADGSARDGLSILDQAISQAAPTQNSGNGTRKVTEMAVRDMLGLADRAQVFDLFDAVMTGDVKKALDLLANQYAAGASPVVVLQDLLELVHWLTRMKVAPDGASDPALAETERTRGIAMSERLGMPVLTRSWQMLLKGLGEARAAPMPLQAVEMVIVRMAYAAELPTPADAIKSLESGAPRPQRAPSSAPASNGAPTSGGAHAVARSVAMAAPAEHAPQPMAQAAPQVVAHPLPQPQTFAEVVELLNQKREPVLATQLKRNARLVRFELGLIEFNPERAMPKELAGQIGKLLTDWTGQRWVVSIVNAAGQPTLHEQELEHVKADPLVKSILEAFPGATIEAVRKADEK